MKALTLKQPWAYLVCSGVKNIENRTWKCPEKYIGKRVLIHAGYAKQKSIQNTLSIEQFKEYNKTAREDKRQFFKGCVLGSVRIIDCFINHPSIWAEKTGGGKTVYNWILEDAILFDKPILDVKGKLSFWESNHEILVCPKCGSHCLHNNSDVGVSGWGHPVCECKCGYMIQGSEFVFID